MRRCLVEPECRIGKSLGDRQFENSGIRFIVQADLVQIDKLVEVQGYQTEVLQCLVGRQAFFRLQFFDQHDAVSYLIFSW